MVHSNKVTTIIERVKWHSKGLNAQEREMLRDELLSLLLFRSVNETNGNDNTTESTFKGLTEEEKSLIKKLASQTDKLSKLKRDDENQNS